MTSAEATKAVPAIKRLMERPLVGGECCALPAADVLREELEHRPEITRAVADPETGHATLTLESSSIDLELVYEMLDDLRSPAYGVPGKPVERR